MACGYCNLCLWLRIKHLATHECRCKNCFAWRRQQRKTKMRPAMLQSPPSWYILRYPELCTQGFRELWMCNLTSSRGFNVQGVTYCEIRDACWHWFVIHVFTGGMRCESASGKRDDCKCAKVCALKPELFLLVPPDCGNPPCILLRDPPSGAVANACRVLPW